MARVHVTRNGKPTYQLWYTDPVTEKRRWRSTDTTDRREAERAAARWETELESLDEALDRRITWDAFRGRYNTEHLAGLSAPYQATASTSLSHFETLVEPARLASITPAVLSNWVAQLRRRGLSDTSVRTYAKHLRAALGWAKTQRLLAEVPQFPTIKTVSRETVMRGRPITGEEFDRMLTAVPKLIDDENVPVWHLYLRSLWLSGLRLAESVALSWDETEPFCLTWESGRPYYRIYGEGQKSRRDQLLPVTPDFAELLETITDRSGPVFTLPGRRNKILRTADGVGRLVAAYGQIAGIITEPGRYATAHDLRRSFGTRWSKKVRPDVLRQLMRHRSLQTTMAYYVHHTAADLSDEIWTKPEKVNHLVNRPAP